MKKYFWCALSLIFIFQNAFAPEKMSFPLYESVVERPREWQEIMVVGSERVDAIQWAQNHSSEYDTRHEFTVAFLKYLHAIVPLPHSANLPSR